MAKRINVGLDEFNKVNGGITPMKPPGGDCHLVVGGMEAAEAEGGAAPELAVSPAPAPDKASCRVTQPPGGSATKLFDQETPAPGTPPPAKPYRLKSSFVLGCEQPPVATPKRKARRVNPVTGEVEGEAELMMTKFVEKFEKSCKVPPGGHTSRLW